MCSCPFYGKRAMASVSATRSSSPPRNQLLAAMSATDFASLQPHLQPVPMALLKDMERPNRRIETVYFMESGIASVVAVQPDDTRGRSRPHWPRGRAACGDWNDESRQSQAPAFLAEIFRLPAGTRN